MLLRRRQVHTNTLGTCDHRPKYVFHLLPSMFSGTSGPASLGLKHVTNKVEFYLVRSSSMYTSVSVWFIHCFKEARCPMTTLRSLRYWCGWWFEPGSPWSHSQKHLSSLSDTTGLFLQRNVVSRTVSISFKIQCQKKRVDVHCHLI